MSLAMAYATKKRGKKMAEGGEVGFDMIGGKYIKSPVNSETISNAAKSIVESDEAQRQDHIPGKGVKLFAEGGEVSEHEQDADMIARIMHKRKEYSKGGEVANDVGVAEADELPAEFDDLELDDHLDGSQPVDSNEHGDADVSDDPIDRLMMKRKKDKLPRPA